MNEPGPVSCSVYSWHIISHDILRWYNICKILAYNYNSIYTYIMNVLFHSYVIFKVINIDT
jgi:hypothetical protein